VSERVNLGGTEHFEESPSGLDVNPRPPKPARVSRRAAGAVIIIGVLIMALFAYGGYKRQQRQVEALAERGAPRSVAPATAAGAEIARAVPAGSVPAVPLADGKLVLPGELKATQQSVPSPPRSGGSPPVETAAPPPAPNPEPTPEQRRVIAAYEAEQQAILAPTTLRSSIGQQTGSPATSPQPFLPNARGGSDQAYDISNMIRSLTAAAGRGGSETGFPPTKLDSNIEQHPERDKEEFLAKARAAQGSDYLKSTRTPPLSPYEIKAGWEIPAVLEQALNSDLPGELKALVSSNVYDTTTGRYLLIPQGSRMVGAYDSRVGYGQEGAQVVWNRVIYPDGSSLDLGGMIGQDVHGAAGFRDKVDRHYRRLVGFAVLTSMFAAASDLAQSHNRTLLTYPSAGEVAASAVGREVSEVGAQITRRNLNVQPTIKVPIGYRFNVRVNRDVLFEAPYVAREAANGDSSRSR
jgi:type IV secretory pathway VirB10-like protein